MNLTSKMLEDFKDTEYEEMAKWNKEFAIRHKVIKAEPISSSNYLKISVFFITLQTASFEFEVVHVYVVQGLLRITLDSTVTKERV